MTTETKTLEQQLSAAINDLTTQKKSVDTFLKEQEQITKEGKEANAKAVKLGEENAEALNTALTRMKNIEQQLAEGIKAGKTEVTESMGDLFAKSDQVKAFFDGTTRKAQVQFKTGLILPNEQKNTVVTSDATNAPQRTSFIPGPFRRFGVLDLVPTLNTTASVIETPREATFTNNAAETEEATTKPESAITFELVSTNIRTIAHFIRISKQLAEDAPTLASYINVRMAFGVEKRKNQQIIAGNGTGQNLSGMTKSGNYTGYTSQTGLTAIDTIGGMIADLEGTSEYTATGILMNPKDVWALNLLKDSQGRYIFGDPARSPLTNGIWGMPIVADASVPQGYAMVADFNEAYAYWNRLGTVVEMFEQDADNVTKNLITIRAEARGALETRMPAATRYGKLVL